jgi:rod shape-determining protein MreC
VARDNKNTSIFGNSIGAWLPFLFYGMLCVALMLIDSRFAISQYVRAQVSEVLTPVWWLAGRPYAFWQNGVDAVQTNQSLHKQISDINKKQLQSDLTKQQLWLLKSENNELRALLNAKQRVAPTARLVEIITTNLEPNQKRFVINQGTKNKVKVGQVVIDGYGLVGQVVEVYANSSVVIAITDADHAIPVMVTRSGFRSIVFGQGNNRNLALANLTPSDDVKLGDILMTSGLGGRFPAGIPVGVVKAFQQDAVLTFLNAEITPFARLSHGRLLLLLDEAPVTKLEPVKAKVVIEKPTLKLESNKQVQP